ncbi:MAG: aspartate aminotransferase family protein [Actinobacteria bacterium]|nr:aspartate aminotransferase family protein [Actinomycetota bacterium]
MSSADFRAQGHALVDWIAAYLDGIEAHPVVSRVAPGDIRRQLPPHPPEHGEDFAEHFPQVLADIDRVVVPGLTHWQHPSFFAYFPSNTSGPSILGELLSAGLGVQGMLWATSPACTEVETHMLDWLIDLLGLPEVFRSTGPGGGVLQDSASSATLCALLAARERAVDAIADLTRCTVYASEHAHSSVARAVRIAGLDPSNLRLIPADAAYAMRADAFADTLAADVRAGLVPTMVTATVGTTSSTAIDPVRAIATAAASTGCWVHVDAALAGTAAVCPEYRWIHDGLELADSYCFNPHKWMFTNFDCDAFYVADRRSLLQALSATPEYLRNPATASGEVIDYRDWQIPLGRRFRALKLWFVMRHYGAHGLRHHIRAHLDLAQHFAQLVRAHPDFELAAPVPLNLVCFRHRGGEDVNAEIVERCNASGELYLTHTRLDGRYVIRCSIGQTQTRRRHVDAAWRQIEQVAAAVGGQSGRRG